MIKVGSSYKWLDQSVSANSAEGFDSAQPPKADEQQGNRGLRRKAIQYDRAPTTEDEFILRSARITLTNRRLTMKFRSEQTRRFLSCCLLTLIGLGLIVASANAQEFRGSITGRVTDPSGAAVPGAQVTVTNTATNVAASVTTNDAGVSTALYLAPGRYTVAVEKQGFKKLLRTIEVRVSDKLTLDLPLEVGSVSESVTVTADAPVLETASATAGQVIDRRRISELPLSDGNPFTLVRLAPGIGYVGDLKFSRPFDNNGSSDFIADGVPRAGGHEFTLDGVPNTDDNGSSGNRVAFIPPADAVQEFKVETVSFDAQQAHGAGATVNVALKTGTNTLHGTLYEFIRNDVLSANDYFLNRAGTPRPALRYNRFGGTVGGPIILPRFGEGGRSFYNGRNKSFFFFAYEGLRDLFPEPRQDTVPTLPERGGNLSALLGSQVKTTISKDGNCAGVKGAVVGITNRDGSPALAGQLYDPFTAVTVSRCNPLTGNIESHVERLPFAGNIIPDFRMRSIARAYLQFYPLPNQAGGFHGRENLIKGKPRFDTLHLGSYRFY